MWGERREHRQALSVMAGVWGILGEGMKRWRTADPNSFFPSTRRLALGGSDFVLGVASQSCTALHIRRAVTQQV